MKSFAYMFAVGLVSASAVLWSAPAHAQEGPWSVSFDLGSQLPVSGDVHGAGTGRILNLPASVSARSYNDIYGQGFYWAAGLGYRITPKGELRVQAGYTANAADRVQVGTVADLATFAQFDDYKALGIDFGYRQYLSTSKVRPFVGGSVGFTRVDTINSTFTVPAANVTLPNVPMNGSSTVPSFALSGGAQVMLNDHLGLQGGLDLRWHGNLEQNEGLGGTGLERINDETSRWALPLTVGVTYRF